MENKMKKSGIQKFISKDISKDLLYFITAGSVDDGKSTLIGRLLHDSKMIYEDHLKAVKDASVSKSSSQGELDFSFFTDGLKAEREQGITIDVAYRYFSTEKRKFIIIDCPGHEQYTRNMATGASNANLALVIIDAQKGISIQSKRHSFICSLLGIPHMVIVINKMDKVLYSPEVYNRIRAEFENFAAKLSITDLHFIPVSALKGDNVVEKSPNMKWFRGSTLLEYLENVYVASDKNLIDLRFPVQYVIKDEDNHRYYAGRIASGIVRIGDKVKVLPSGKTTIVSGISIYNRDLEYAFANQSISLKVSEDIDICAGDIIVHPNNLPEGRRVIEAMLISFSEKPISTNTQYLLKNYSTTVKAVLSDIFYKVDVNTLHKKDAKELCINEIGRVCISCSRTIFQDCYANNRKTGAFILIDPISNNTVACGMIIERNPLYNSDKIIPKFAEERISKRITIKSLVEDKKREEIFKQRPCTVWFTGLLSSGKRDIAYELEKLLVLSGHPCIVIEGGELRKGIDQELGFSKTDLLEHIRRGAETAKLINKSGIVAICSFISAEKSHRDLARKIIGEDLFIEVFVDASLDWCTNNDLSGLYKRAKDGHINNLPGLSTPYEKPEKPDIKLTPENTHPADSALIVFNYIKERGFIL